MIFSLLKEKKLFSGSIFRLFIMLAFFSTLLSCSTTFTPGTSRRIPEDFFGMAHAGDTRTEEEYELLDDLSAVWMRKTFRWNQIEETEGAWDFERWDDFVDSGKAAGKKILAVLAYDVGWIYGEDVEARRHIIPEKIPYFLRYVEEVVLRYKGRIDAYEIWNEPNWTFWRGPNKDFYELSRAAAEKIREIDPEAYIIAASVSRVPKGFIKGMFKAGAMDQADAISFHPYAVSPKASVRLFDKLEKIVKEFGFTGDIWITEVGYPTKGWYPTRVSEKNFPAYVVKTLTGHAARGVKVLFWYELFDKYNKGEAPSKLDSELYFGLAYPDYARKDGAAAYALCGKYIAGTDYRPDLVTKTGLPSSAQVLLFCGSSAQTLVLWNEGGSVPVKVSLSGTQHLVHDIASGGFQTVSAETELVLTKTPVILTWTADASGEAAQQIEVIKR
ncbi:hypothetical protein K7I13_10390 [Brucepastera parasyntrophica]|uniref:glycosyl hydrolase n=1 Tax=Brucepastera parasyntrophica TaxID=2880008 RepID=UPI002108A60A|nr:glycosyl hydrolase [Brucepastera parasyntrophica]ULQ58930.1 hypothetical protein K7I13_10390 [Brucepastera parasyntrophica]